MTIDYNGYNSLLNKKLQALSEKDKDYWSFRGNANREYGHGLFQYPAMMVPQVTRVIIDKIIEVQPDVKIISDPFVGSGTVMTESMLRGLSFCGTDINPLAILLCQVKSGPFFISELIEKSAALKANIKQDKKTNIEVDFFNRNKWFTRSVQIWLSKIRRTIQMEESLWARRFFWVALAETIRLASNSRTSTFKLHIRTEKNIEERRAAIDPLELFYKTLDRNLAEYNNLFLKLQENNLLVNGQYEYNTRITFADVRSHDYSTKSDVIITSPPYGDNITTVPYGQHSYLPLQWIDFSDIDLCLKKEELLKSTREIDNQSLGGHQKITEKDINDLFQQSESLKHFFMGLHDKAKDKIVKVAAFFRDLDMCIDPILNGLNAGGIMVWVLGNRKVGKQRVPLDKILVDLFKKRGVTVFCQLARKIPSKRMALKNNMTDTMSDEIILLMRKAN
jgi:site-specific DNA-adenine methylase